MHDLNEFVSIVNKAGEKEMESLYLDSVMVKGQKEALLETSADYIVRVLEKLGVEYVFGIPGGAIEPFFNALARSEKRAGGIKTIVARHESGAAFMADGYTRETGKLGVCCATTGPGATNLLTGVACAYTDNIPMLVISAQTKLDVTGRGAWQDSSCDGVDTLSVFKNCTQYNTLVTHIHQLPTKLLKAISLAYGPNPGPVHLTIARDVFTQLMPVHEEVRCNFPSAKSYAQEDLEALLRLFENQRAGVFLLGRGAQSATECIMKLAEKLGWPVVTMPAAKGLIASNHPLNLGVFGFAGHAEASRVISDKQRAIVAIGCLFYELEAISHDGVEIDYKRVWNISGNPEHLARKPFTRASIHACPQSLVSAVLKQIKPVGVIALKWEQISSGAAEYPLNYKSERRLCSADAPIRPALLFETLSRTLPENTTVLFDIGNSFCWGVHHWQFRHSYEALGGKNLMRIGMGFASMGWAIGAAVGTAFGTDDKKRPVVCITGDGAYLMSGQEITVAREYGLSLIMIVLNDTMLGMIKHGQQLADAEKFAHELPRVDFAGIGRSLGVRSYRCNNWAEFGALDFDELISADEPILLDLVIDSRDCPPIHARVANLMSQTGT